MFCVQLIELQVICHTLGRLHYVDETINRHFVLVFSPRKSSYALICKIG